MECLLLFLTKRYFSDLQLKLAVFAVQETIYTNALIKDDRDILHNRKLQDLKMLQNE